MMSSYGKLVLFRAATAAINLLVIAQLNIPLDLIALIVGIWVTRPAVRGVIFALEVLNVMVAALGCFFGNYVGSLFGIAVNAICLYAMCRPDIKERFA